MLRNLDDVRNLVEAVKAVSGSYPERIPVTPTEMKLLKQLVDFGSGPVGHGFPGVIGPKGFILLEVVPEPAATTKFITEQ